MSAGTRDIVRRIKSVNNTKKITKAMEMVAASKMKRATNMVLATRPYANLSWNVILNLSKVKGSESHPLLLKKEKYDKILFVLLSSNRGLCGGYNVQIFNKSIATINQYEKGKEKTDIVTMGTKGAEMMVRAGYHIVSDFEKPDLATSVNEVHDLAKMIIDNFLKGEHDKVVLAYTDFVSPVKQIPRIKQLLPVEIDVDDEYLGEANKNDDDKPHKDLKREKNQSQYLFEPNSETVLSEMIPRLIEIQLYQALLEANASEHSARMVSMKNASDAAGDMIKDLTLYYNKARQASVTSEIAEISAGAAAMSE